MTSRLIALYFIACAACAFGQSYPTKPIRLVVPFAPGGGTDAVARVVALKVADALGQSVVPDNRAGAGGTIGAEIVAKSPPDGYTLLLGSSGPLAINPALYAKLPYDVARDFAPVSLVTMMPFVVVVHPSLPVRDVRELVALAKARPNQLNYGSPGRGSTTHLATELLKSMTGIQLTHVPYKGVAPAATDLMSGQIQIMSGDLSTLLPHIRSGRMRAIAVTSLARSSVLPQIPTVAGSGVPGYEATGWFGVLAPAGIAPPVLERLNAAINKGLASPDARKTLLGFGGEVAAGPPEQFGGYIRSESAKWSKLIQALHLKADQ